MPVNPCCFLGLSLVFATVGQAEESSAPSALEQYIAGQKAAAVGDYAAALRHFLAAEEQGYEDLRLHYEMGRIYEHLGCYEEARERFNRFARGAQGPPRPPSPPSSHPRSRWLPPIQPPAGWRLTSTVEEDGAEAGLHEAAALAPPEPAAALPSPSAPPEPTSTPPRRRLAPVRPTASPSHPRYQMALLFLRRRQYAEALTALRQYLAEAPEAAHRDEAERTLRSLEEVLQKKKLGLREGPQGPVGREGSLPAPSSPSLASDRAAAKAFARQLRTGIKKAEAKDFDGALSAFQRAFSIAPQSPVEVHSRSWLTYWALGQALQGVGRLQEALSAFQQAVQRAPQEPLVHFHLALIHQALGQLDEAAAAYREVIRLQPDRPEPHNNLALVLKKQGRWEEAIAEYRTAVQLQPEEAVSRSNLAAALFQRERWEEAAAEYRTLSQQHPHDPLPRCMMGRALAAQGKLEEALEELWEAVRRAPDHPLPHHTLAWFHLVAPGEPYRDLAVGLKEARRAVELAPQNPYCLGTLGLAYYRSGDYPASLQWTHQGLDASQEAAARALNLYLGSMAQARLGHWEAAVKLYQAAVAADPHHELRGEAQTLLREGSEEEPGGVSCP